MLLPPYPNIFFFFFFYLLSFDQVSSFPSPASPNLQFMIVFGSFCSHSLCSCSCFSFFSFFSFSDLSTRVDSVKSENATMRTENGVLKDYIDNLLSKVNEEQTQAQFKPKNKTKIANPAGSSHAVQVNRNIGELRTPKQSFSFLSFSPHFSLHTKSIRQRNNGYISKANKIDDTSKLYTFETA